MTCRLLVVVLAVVALALGAAPSRADGSESTCVTCHEVDIDEVLALPVPEWRESVHAAHWVSCDACHGGDPRIEDADESMSEEAGFMDLPSWSEMAAHCGMCHEAIAESWQDGRYGLAVAAGQRPPTCATCHMQDGHRTVEAAPEQLAPAATCESCPALEDAPAFEEQLRAVRRDEARVAESIARVEGLGLAAGKLRAELGAAHERFQLAVHRFDDAALRTAVARESKLHAAIDARALALEETMRSRRRLGYALLGALALLSAAAWVGLRVEASSESDG